ncbi:MAG: 4Fe-4S dicluster domain-containing protein [Deltaproteobacteria bacterium]|nr:4Fe-4S dicluster domain-containing protein [Deltaproteobacteria bacterium]
MLAKLNRRNFLEVLGQATAAGGLIVLLGPRATQATTTPEDEAYDWEEHSYVYLIDISKCIGCGSCVRGCKAENDVPDGFYRTWVERYAIAGLEEVRIDSPQGGLNGFQPDPTAPASTKSFFVPKLCNHCSNTPCVQVCPVGASYQTKDGLVLVDKDHCVGCGYCVQACPYGSRFLDPETHTAEKCTWCYHRISKGELPACVASCPTGTRRFGDLKREGDEVVAIIRSQNVGVLAKELLTKPRCYYLHLDGEVR